MNKGAKFSECGKYRYYLYRIWDDIQPLALCIGLNPSTANAEDDDRTITNLTALLQDNGFGGFYMANVFALISPNPEDLRSTPDPLKDNDYWLDKLRGMVTVTIFCWGSFKQAQYRIKSIVSRFPGAMCLGKTDKGKPIHPLAATVWMKSKCKLQLY